MGLVISLIESQDFIIAKMKMTRLTRETAAQYFQDQAGQGYYSALLDYMTSDLVVAMELVADSAIQKWQDLSV